MPKAETCHQTQCINYCLKLLPVHFHHEGQERTIKEGVGGNKKEGKDRENKLGEGVLTSEASKGTDQSNDTCYITVICRQTHFVVK
jgi:hypothetical protein